jgi:two-component system chemotaxis response regulator CheY
VEDDYTSRLLLQTILARYGECDVADGGKEAVHAFFTARASGHAYDLICLDIMMPIVDGHAVLRCIRDDEAERGVLTHDAVKVIMTTALDDIETVFASFHGLCDAYLVKPTDTAKLIAHLRAFGLIGESEAAARAK